MKRASGVLLHISSLWGDYSEGSFGAEAREWVDFLADCGFSYWQVLPFCLPDEYHSPYKSFSAFSGNPFFIDLPTLYQEGLLTETELKNARQQTPYACEFDRLSEERMQLLARAAKRFQKQDRIEAFLRENPQIDAFCRFMALKKGQNGLAWNDWESDPDPDPETLSVWRFTQYTFFSQWESLRRYARSRGVRIIGDLPIYVAEDSADVWQSPDQFLLDASGRPEAVAGVPPDYFCADGQRWGNPLYNWDAMRQNGFSWWGERMRFMAGLFDGIRIDHFRAFESYYSIPAADETARGGHWEKGPGMELLRTFDPVCADRLLIAEDLGVITPEVRALVEKSGYPGMRVLQFAFLGDPDSPHLPHHYENHCVAYTGTHDNNTLLGYIWELEPENRARLLEYFGYTGADWNACYDTVLRAMFASHAGLLILPVQDILLFGRDTRLNTPGASTGNWSYRVTAEQFRGIDREKFRKWNTLYGRSL